MSLTKRFYALVALVMAGLIFQATAFAQVKYVPDATYTFKTSIGAHGMAYQGVGGDIDGVLNPKIEVPVGAVVQITLINGDGAQHDIAVPQFNVQSDYVQAKDSSTVIVFKADEEGEFEYLCTLPGHKAAGMYGKLIVGKPKPKVQVPTVAKDPTDIPGPIAKRAPTTVTYDIESFEHRGRLADGTSYSYWTFNETVPGPMLRARVNDTIHINFKNNEKSRNIHSLDFHAVTGPGGGATVLQVPPGKTQSLTFKALKPGVYVYHCATPMVAHHIANGMYGLIVIEPEEGLPKVDREFYVMQGEIYTVDKFGFKGEQEFDVDKLLKEDPEYFVFNGTVDALTHQYPLQAKTGETVRIFFGVGGPNFISSFHVIGEIFDKVYDHGSFTAPAIPDVQTTMVAPGAATAVEFKLDVPGDYILVDHALSRAERGLVGVLSVEGKERPDIYKYSGPQD